MKQRNIGARAAQERAQSKVDSHTRFRFDQERQTWICPKHGDVGDNTAWVPCWNGCDDGYFDCYEEDPLWYDEGDMEICDVCRGEGGWRVCGECNLNNPDAEF